MSDVTLRRQGQLELVLTFKRDTLSPGHFAEMLEAVRFPLRRFYLNSAREAHTFVGAGDIAAVRTAKEVKNLSAQSDDDLFGSWGPHFKIVTLATTQSVFWQAELSCLPSADEIVRWTRLPGFCTGLCADAFDTWWQSCDDVSFWELCKRDHSHLRQISRPRPLPPKLDLSSHAGRRTLVNGIWFQAAWKMWFGPGSHAYIPPLLLESFDGARHVERHGDLTFVRLYDEPFSASTKSTRELERRFRAWTSMDTLLERATEIEPPDPSYEIQVGAFPHGGDRLLIAWLDSSGEPTVRSKAVRKSVVECRSTGGVVWTETGPA